MSVLTTSRTLDGVSASVRLLATRRVFEGEVPSVTCWFCVTFSGAPVSGSTQ
jgi:hypothetical protein